MSRGSETSPLTIAGRTVKPVELDVAGRVQVFVYESADPEQTLRHAIETGESDPYATVLWPASIAAAEALTALPIACKRVLDLAAGTGLCALTAAAMGGSAVALDHDPTGLALIAASAAAQKLDVDILLFDICSDDPLPAGDVLTIADILYQNELSRRAAGRVIEAVRRGMRVVIADPGRFGRVEFDELIEGAGIPLYYTSRMVQPPREPETLVDVVVLG